MNERIQKLADEAGLYVDLYGKPWPKSMSAEECEVAYKKFAELIVRECAEMVRIQNEQFMQNESHYGVVSTDVLKHFGVEE